MGAIVSGFLGVFSVLSSLIFNTLGTITGAFLGMAVMILNWVLSSNFISLSYTNPDGNDFIRIGWTLTRDITNIFFVVALVAIGIGTALRKNEYHVKVTLKNLILVALLVNFTPVITGLIVDASNIAMNFFINPQGSSASQIIWQKALSQWSNISVVAGGLQFWDPTKTGGALAAAVGSLTLVLFNVVAGFIYLLFAALFTVRYIAIWLLVIVSPFAFAAYILPITRGYFQQWWKAFTQWSIVGIIASFFLYLSEHLVRIISSPGFINGAMQDAPQTPGLSLIVNSILPYFMPIILLFIGLTSALAGAPKGAEKIMDFGKKGLNTIRSSAGSFATGAIRGIPALNKAELFAKKRLETMPVLGRAFGGPGATMIQLEQARKKAGKDLESRSADDIRKIIKDPAFTRDDKLRKARGLEILAERGNLEEKDKIFVQEAINFGVKKNDIYNKMPHWAGSPADIRKQIEGMDVEEARKNLSSRAFEITNLPPAGSPAGTLPTHVHNNDHLENFYAMDLAKITDIGQKGKRTQKEAIRRLSDDRFVDIYAKINTLRATGGAENIKEADRIERIWNEVQTNPNFVA